MTSAGFVVDANFGFEFEFERVVTKQSRFLVYHCINTNQNVQLEHIFKMVNRV